MNSKVQEYLEKIDKVIAEGPYRDDWASLSRYSEPEWYKKAKLGCLQCSGFRQRVVSAPDVPGRHEGI